MVDLDPFLDAPFEEASNRSFEALLVAGIVLLAIVAGVGRSTVTMAAVAVYLLLVPIYVGYRVRVWEDDADPAAEPADGSDDDRAAAGESGDEADESGAEAAVDDADGEPEGNDAGDETGSDDEPAG